MSFGKMAVDWEDRVDFDRLRKDRIEKMNKAMHKHGIGSMIIYDWDVKRYVSSYWAHPYTKHHPSHFHLLLRDAGFPYVGAGRYAEEHRCSWLKDRMVGSDVLSEPAVSNAGMLPTEELASRWKKTAQQVKALMKKHRVADLPISIDYSSVYTIDALRKEGIEVVDGNGIAQEARIIKTDDEAELMRMASTCNEAGYAALAKVLRPGMRENDARGVFLKAAHEAGAEYEEGWVTGSGIREAPRRYNWSDRMIRPGELFTIECCHVNFCGYKTCQDRTFMVGAPPNEIQKEIYQYTVDIQRKMMNYLRPGITTHDALKARDSWTPMGTFDGVRLLKSLKEIKDARAKVSLTNHFGGQGISHGEAPTFNLAVPPVKLEKNMMIAHALCLSVMVDGQWCCGIGIENTYRITDTGCENLTVYPWEELIVVGYP